MEEEVKEGSTVENIVREERGLTNDAKKRRTYIRKEAGDNNT